MGDDEGCTSFFEYFERILNQGFGFGINIGCSFIQNKNGWIKCQRTGKGNQLTLPSRQRASFFNNRFIETLRQMG
ncbi:hypothetical protein D3C73_1347700 [compost metagenome]